MSGNGNGTMALIERICASKGNGFATSSGLFPLNRLKRSVGFAVLITIVLSV
jgi:hypothetical protein